MNCMLTLDIVLKICYESIVRFVRILKRGTKNYVAFHLLRELLSVFCSLLVLFVNIIN